MFYRNCRTAFWQQQMPEFYCKKKLLYVELHCFVSNLEMDKRKLIIHAVQTQTQRERLAAHYSHSLLPFFHPVHCVHLVSIQTMQSDRLERLLFYASRPTRLSLLFKLLWKEATLKRTVDPRMSPGNKSAPKKSQSISETPQQLN